MMKNSVNDKISIGYGISKIRVPPPPVEPAAVSSRKNQLKSLRTLGLAVKAHNRFKGVLREKETRRFPEETPYVFDSVFETLNNFKPDKVVNDGTTGVTMPKMSKEMRHVIRGLNKDDLLTIMEDDEEGLETIECPNNETEHGKGKLLLPKRPRWNNFVYSKIIPKQNIIRRLQSKRRVETPQVTCPKGSCCEGKRPDKISKTTQSLLKRSSDLDLIVKAGYTDEPKPLRKSVYNGFSSLALNAQEDWKPTKLKKSSLT